MIIISQEVMEKNLIDEFRAKKTGNDGDEGG
jgi:hypothetical protein